jgi:hypothetical protein
MSFFRSSSLALAALALTQALAGCRPSSEISAAPGSPNRPTTSSGGLGNLGGGNSTPDAGTGATDPNIKPWPEAGAPGPDAAGETKIEMCAGESQAAKQVPVDLLLLVDRSGSMTARVPAGKSKWEMAQEALTTFITDTKSAGLGVGLQYFPLIAGCATDLDCGFPSSSVTAPACLEERACIGPAGTLSGLPQLCGARRELPCPTGTTCTPIGRCSETGAPCTNLGQACVGGSASNRCATTGKTCRDSSTPMCQTTDYQKLAVPIGDLPAAAPALALSLAQTMPYGGTPTDPAVAAALGELRARATAHPERHEVLVLVTDGVPNSCAGNPVPLITGFIADALKGMPSISTYAIGVFSPDDFGNGEASLRDWAAAGGTGMPFVLNAGDDLNQKLLDALNQIRGSALPCEYMIPQPATGTLDYKKVNVHITSGTAGVDLLYVGNASKCDPVKGGWYYDADPDMGGTPTRVIMCEATCKKFKMDATSNIELRFGCETVVIP